MPSRRGRGRRQVDHPLADIGPRSSMTTTARFPLPSLVTRTRVPSGRSGAPPSSRRPWTAPRPRCGVRRSRARTTRPARHRAGQAPAGRSGPRGRVRVARQGEGQQRQQGGQAAPPRTRPSPPAGRSGRHRGSHLPPHDATRHQRAEAVGAAGRGRIAATLGMAWPVHPPLGAIIRPKRPTVDEAGGAARRLRSAASPNLDPPVLLPFLRIVAAVQASCSVPPAGSCRSLRCRRSPPPRRCASATA